MPEITVVGSLNLDTTVRVPRLPRSGETVLGTGHFDDTGGKGANQAVAAARLGRDVAMLGMVGDDDAGRRLLAALQEEGVDVAGVVVGPAPTGMAIITVDEEGENSIVVDPSANGAYGATDVSVSAGIVEQATVVLMQLEIPLGAVGAALDAARGTVILNPAPAAHLPPEVLERVGILVPNATELALLADSPVPTSPVEAVQAARRLEGPGAVVVTLGAQGAVAVAEGEDLHVAAPEVEAVDPTAAGDAFCGGLADALVRGESLGDAVEWAVRCGAVAATRWGAQRSLPTREDVLALEAGS